MYKCWDTLRPAVFTSTRIRSGVSCFRWQSVEAIGHGFWEAGIHLPRAKTGAPRASGAVPQALTLFEGAKFITRCLRWPFLGECWLCPSHFGECQAYLCPDPPLKSLVPHSPVWWGAWKIPVSTSAFIFQIWYYQNDNFLPVLSENYLACIILGSWNLQTCKGNKIQLNHF